MPVEIFIRYTTVRGVKYLRQEDVCQYLQELASSEKTDTRKRLEMAIRLLGGKSQ